MALSVGSLFTFIIVLLACGLLVWLAFYVVQQFAPPEPVGTDHPRRRGGDRCLGHRRLLLNFAGIGTGIRITDSTPCRALV